MGEFKVFKDNDNFKINFRKIDKKNKIEFSEKIKNLCLKFEVDSKDKSIPIIEGTISRLPRSIYINTENMEIKGKSEEFHEELTTIIKQCFFTEKIKSEELER